jgi:hypothetical protein
MAVTHLLNYKTLAQPYTSGVFFCLKVESQPQEYVQRVENNHIKKASLLI